MIKKEVVMFILNNENKVLLQKRSVTKKHNPNKWCLCAGHVEEYDNSFLDAAVREIKEELGVDVKKEQLKQLAFRDDGLHITYFYYTKIDKNEDEFVIQTEKLSEVKWFDIDTVIDMIIKKDSNLVFTDKILKLLKELKVLLYN